MITIIKTIYSKVPLSRIPRTFDQRKWQLRHLRVQTMNTNPIDYRLGMWRKHPFPIKLTLRFSSFVKFQILHAIVLIYTYTWQSKSS